MPWHGSEANKRNTDIRQGQWPHRRGEVQQWWGTRTDNDLDRLAGTWKKWRGRLQERDGDAPEHVASAADQRPREEDRVARAQAGGLGTWSTQQGCGATWVSLCL